MIDTRRRLPHWIPDGVPVFVTWRLAGTLPHPINPTSTHQSQGQRFVAVDDDLNRSHWGPRWLQDERVASMIVQALQHGRVIKQWYELHAYVVMPNHVHVVWTPKVAMPCVLRWLKGATSYRAKNLLRLESKNFWQEESYDHWIRSERELQKTIRYVEWNPVKAGLAASVDQWIWSSAYTETRTTRSSALPVVKAL